MVCWLAEFASQANNVNCTHPSSDEREQTLRAELAACREELRAKREGPDPDKGDMAVYVPTGEVVLVQLSLDSCTFGVRALV